VTGINRQFIKSCQLRCNYYAHFLPAAWKCRDLLQFVAVGSGEVALLANPALCIGVGEQVTDIDGIVRLCT
jgi:hypothetical protein